MSYLTVEEDLSGVQKLVKKILRDPSCIILKHNEVNETARVLTKRFSEAAEAIHQRMQMTGAKRSKGVVNNATNKNVSNGHSTMGYRPTFNLIGAAKHHNEVILTDQSINSEQIWGQLEYRNKNLLRVLRRNVYEMEKLPISSKSDIGQTVIKSEFKQTGELELTEDIDENVIDEDTYNNTDGETGDLDNAALDSEMCVSMFGKVDRDGFVCDIEEGEEGFGVNWTEGMNESDDGDVDDAYMNENVEDEDNIDDGESSQSRNALTNVITDDEEDDENSLCHTSHINGDDNGEDVHGLEADNFSDTGVSDDDLINNSENVNTQITHLENKLMSNNKWTMQGEVASSQRPENSLLNEHLDFGRYRRPTSTATAALTATLGEMDVESVVEDSSKTSEALSQVESRVSEHIENIVKQRIANSLFDDVIRRHDTRPSTDKKAAQGEEDVVETLDFKKSKVGLGDVYAADYEERVLGADSANKKELDKSKQEIVDLFVKVMYKLDSLTNLTFTPKPPKRSSNNNCEVPSIRVEDTIPLVISTSYRKGPEEVTAPEHLKQPHEMTQREKNALRLAKKRRRKKIKGNSSAKQNSVIKPVNQKFIDSKTLNT